MMKVDEMMEYVMKAHSGQYRKYIQIPYFTHCMEVMKRVSLYTENEDILCIAIGHDLLEDCDVSYNDLVETFGLRVADGIKECTRIGGDDVTKLQKFEFLESFHNKSTESILVKIADRLCNVRDYTYNKDNRTYYAKYALQAYPLYQAYTCRHKHHIHSVTHNSSQVVKDLIELEQLLGKKYSINIFESNQYDKIKKIVV